MKSLCVLTEQKVNKLKLEVQVPLQEYRLDLFYRYEGSRVSSGSMVSDYGLDKRGSIPAGQRIFSYSLCVQTGSGAHPVSCTMGTGGRFPGDKARPGRDADHSPPSSAEVENE
jgi:hypothetical protein